MNLQRLWFESSLLTGFLTLGEHLVSVTLTYKLILTQAFYKLTAKHNAIIKKNSLIQVIFITFFPLSLQAHLRPPCPPDLTSDQWTSQALFNLTRFQNIAIRCHRRIHSFRVNLLFCLTYMIVKSMFPAVKICVSLCCQ